MTTFKISGRVVSTDGIPRENIAVTICARISLSADEIAASGTTDANGRYAISWSESVTPDPWDLFVRADDGEHSVDSPLICNLGDQDPNAVVDLILGEGSYRGRSEWARLTAKLTPILGATAAKDVGTDRFEWLARRADVFPLHLGLYVQAHRLAEARTIPASSFYAFMRAGLPADLPGLLRAGAQAWSRALKQAWARQILDLPGDGSQAALDAALADTLEAMRALLVDAALARPSAGTNTRLIFDSAGLSEAEQRSFSQAWVGRTGTLADFWQQVETELGAAKTATFQFTIAAAAAVANHLPTLAALQAERVANNLSTVRDLAAWSAADWETVLSAHDVATPEGMPGADAAAQRSAYARGLARLIEDAYPTLTLRHAIARDEAQQAAPAHTAELVTFFTQNPDFEITSSNVSRWLADNPNAFANTSDPAVARANLERVQRVYRLTPRLDRYDSAKVLLDHGVGSAAQIVAQTRDEFIAATSGLLPADHHDPVALAGKIWDNASKIHGAAIGLASQLALAETKADFVPLAIPGAKQFAGAENGLGDLWTILGDLDYCACEQCRSVFSPAAYLADLLHFLRRRPAKQASDALAALEQRRPDLRQILLDCANTNTPMPAIDLVNELLEAQLSGSSGAHQTSWRADELRLHPEHLDAAVYDAGELVTAVHPWTLPFSLATVEARVYLRHLGVERHELMRRFAKVIPADSFLDQRAGEVLGLNALEVEIVGGTFSGNASTDGREFWGFSVGAQDDGWVGILNGTHAEAGDVGELLRRSGLGLDDLRELLTLDFIQHGAEGTVALQWSETCALAGASIAYCDAGVLDRLHRFTRLQRRSGIPAAMLDVLLVDVCAGTLDTAALRKLAEISQLQRRLNLGWDELATFWATTIDARDRGDGRSLYQRRVLARDLDVPQVFTPVGDGSLYGESDANAKLSDHLPVVLAALGIGEADYWRLIDSQLADDGFSFANLTALLRCTLLAQALRLTITELIALAGVADGLTATDPFASPAMTLAFLELVEGLRDSSLSPAELDWLLRHRSESDAGRYDQDAAARQLAALGRDLDTIVRESAQLSDPDGQALLINLDALLGAGDRATIVAIVEGTSAEDLATQQQQIDALLASFLDAALAKAALLLGGAGYLEQLSERRAWLLGRLVSWQRRRALVIDTVANAVAVPATVAEALLFDVLTVPGGADSLGASLMTASSDAIQDVHRDGWLRVTKAGLLAARLELRADEVRWYSGRGLWLDLDALPLRAEDPAASFESWERLRQALTLRSGFPMGVLGHAAIAEASDFSQGIARFAAYRGWDGDDLLTVATGLGYGNLAELGEERALLRLAQIGETSQRLGPRASVLLSWVEQSPTMAIAGAIKAAARAKYDERSWPKVAAPLRDAIREQQRDALVDAVLAKRPALRDRAGLFAELLIDVDVGACMQTSRIKHAISSVQLYVQRVLLHLEREQVELGAEAIARWEWIKHYRVWEANRRVFSYPENWIEPQLRPGKSPEFEALEATLMQGVLDERRVLGALTTYLQRLDAVSRLEIVGVYQRRRWDDLWLLGRSAGTPRDWFVRRRNTSGSWEPWEAVPQQIDGDAVALVVHGARVHLFWANSYDVVVGEQGRICYRISHCERSEDGWGKVTVSEASDPQSPEQPSRHIRIQTWPFASEIRMAILAQDNASMLPCGRAAFGFDPSAGAWTYFGANFSDSQGFTEHFTLTWLADKSTISLQSDHVFDSSRYINASFTDGGGETWFSQGDYHALLFGGCSSPEHAPALIHHSDIWTYDAVAKALPVVYDDRKRKYLLEPYPRYEHAGSAGQAANTTPQIIGALDYSGVWTCPPAGEVAPPKAKPPRAARQKLHDGVTEAKLWKLGVPGQIKGLAELGKGVELQAATAFEAPALLQQAQAQAQAHDGLADDFAAPAAPTGFCLALEPLYHPYARAMVEALARGGLAALYAPKAGASLFRQQGSHDPFGVDELDLNPEIIRGNAPIESFDFRQDSPYGLYNWELFYHVPMLIARKLRAEQRFEEAQRWHHLVFNPIDLVTGAGETETSKYWRIKPFVEQSGALAKDQLEAMLGIGVSEAQQSAAIEQFSAQVKAWQQAPFDPHAIARVRPGVYQRALLRDYFDNLLAWADHLFARDSIESINEATGLYLLLAQLLGQRPQAVPGPDADTAQTFDQLEASGLDAFSNALVALEGFVHLPGESLPLQKLGCGESAPEENWLRVPVLTRSWYFCYPPNAALLKYWDLVADRLWKIRHCRNIDGVERRLPLFQPPIDPGLLVRATAAGVDLQSVLGELESGLPPYRFRSVHGRAVAFCASLRALASQLLAALEKRDAEQLARLRSEQELTLRDRIRDLRVRQIDEARQMLESLQAARAMVEQRRSYYADLAKDNYEASLSEGEHRHFDLAKSAHVARQQAGVSSMVGSVLGAIPQLSIGTDMSSKFGGLHLANVTNAVAAGKSIIAAHYDFHANKATLTAGYKRRRQDWEHQRAQADKELHRISKDILAAEIRLELATRELANHDLQTEQARELDAYMRGKFSNRELYDWMIAQLSTLTFQSYQLAFDLAKRAERAYRRELAIPTGEAPIITYGYWDSLRKGLLAGERLHHDLERLELAYMDHDLREFELRKSISLAALDPVALRDLQERGQCSFSLPELLFDLDHPGHYLRRIKALRLTIPAVVGPYTSLGARLELVDHRTRVSTDAADYGDQELPGRFEIGYGGGEAIATSTAVADGGLFNLDFRDERYLPFEYAGVISSWTLTLPDKVRQIDYRTISDVVVHLDYSAREGGLREAAEDHSLAALTDAVAGQPQTALIVAHEAFPKEWARFLDAPEPGAGDQLLTLPLDRRQLPYLAQRLGVDVTRVELALQLAPGVTTATSLPLGFSLTGGALDLATVDGTIMLASTGALAPAGTFEPWTLSLAEGAAPAELAIAGRLDPAAVAGLLLIVHYTLKA